jgi:hypothetical protein
MITLQQFLTRYNGKYIEVAGTPNALNQCVDLANAYIRDVLDLPIIEWTNAIDFPGRAGDKYLWIPNTPTNVPQEGDIIVWGNSPGHIAIFLEGNVNTFKSFDQNYPLGSPAHIQGHTYANVIGWLRAKPNISPPVVSPQPSNPTIDDKFKYDFGGELGVQEMGAIRSIITDQRLRLDQQAKQLDDLRNSLLLAQNNPKTVIETTFHTKLGQLFFEIAKNFG